MPAVPAFSVHFGPGAKAEVIRVSVKMPGADMLKSLALPQPKALIVLNGGTAEFEPSRRQQLGSVLADGLARLAAEDRITLISGGTDAGVFHLLGQGLARWGRSAPCVGVAVEDLVSWPGKEDGEARLEAHHSHFVLVEGDNWGDETPTMYTLVDALSANCPSLAVFAGGGEIAIQEMLQNAAQGRRMVMLRGSGRVTDRVLNALDGKVVQDERLAAIARDGRITSVDIRQGPDEFAAVIRTSLQAGV